MDQEVSALQLTARPRKKVRLESNDEHESQRMFFELCPDSIDNIVRCTSSSRNRSDWSSFITSEDVSALSNVEGGIGDFITSQFNAIYVPNKLRTLDPSGNWVDADKKDIAFKILRLEKDAFIRDESGDKDERHFHGFNMLKSMSRSSKWKNIEKFVIGGEQTIQTVMLIGLFWKQMKTLVFCDPIAPEIAAALALHCTNIRELTLTLRRGVLDGLRFWETVGNSLEILRLGMNYPAAEELGEIQKHCRKLRNISVYVPGNNASYGQFLASYGAQLELARIRRMVASDLEDVVQRCPNAMFILHSKDTDVPSMRIIGRQLKEVSISKYNRQYTDFTDSWDLCPNLRSISILKVVRIEDVRAMLMTPKLFLKRLVLSIPNFSTFKVIANKVTTLECVRFQCKFPPENENVFEPLILNNKSLREAKIFIQSQHGFPADLRENDTMERVRALTSCFMNSSALESLEISDITSHPIPGSRSPGYFEPVLEMLRTRYRFRRVEVTYFGTRYS